MKLVEPPPNCTRWTPARKAWVAEMLTDGLLTPAAVTERWGVSAEEAERWERLYNALGMKGLYETRKPEPREPEAVNMGDAQGVYYPGDVVGALQLGLPVYLHGETTVETGRFLSDENGFLWPLPDAHAAPYSLTTAQVRPLTRWEIADLAGLECDIPPLPSKLFVSGLGSKIRVGDIVTFASVPRPQWWRRLLAALGWRKLRPRVPSAFVVTAFADPPQPYTEQMAEQEELQAQMRAQANRKREAMGLEPLAPKPVSTPFDGPRWTPEERDQLRLRRVPDEPFAPNRIALRSED
jgi:hypothetical protein